MARMSRLEAGDMLAEARLVKPFRRQAAQAALALGRVISIGAVQRVTREGRRAPCR